MYEYVGIFRYIYLDVQQIVSLQPSITPTHDPLLINSDSYTTGLLQLNVDVAPLA